MLAFFLKPQNLTIYLLRFTIIVLLFVNHLLIGQTTTVNYTGSNAIFANPERGFYRWAGTYSNNHTPLVQSDLEDLYTNNKISVIFRIFYLPNFKNSALSNTYLQKIEADFNTIRNAGLKCVVRFAYTDDYNNGNPPFGDASKYWVLYHINQLKPILQNHADIILTLHAGFIGVWGEWYYSDFFGCEALAPLTTQNINDRREVMDSLLAAVPDKRMVSLRTPEMKKLMYDLTIPEDSITLADAYNKTALARIAAHNDCFLADWNDYTFADTTAEKPYWAAETRYLVMGGETCEDNATYTNCVNAIKEMKRFHWTYCNDSYHPDVLSRWQTEGCYDDMERNLGYRFKLLSGTFTNTAAMGDAVIIELNLKNEGFAACFNTRQVQLILRNTTTNTDYVAPLQHTDPRYWFSGPSLTITDTVGIGCNMPNGTYALYLNIDDTETNLQTNPKYAIQLANTGLYEVSTGYNKLNHNLTIDNNYTGGQNYTGNAWAGTTPPQPEITGLNTACNYNTVTYSVNYMPGHTYTWSVTGGIILSGQGSNTVTIMWQNAGNASISVSESY